MKIGVELFKQQVLKALISLSHGEPDACIIRDVLMYAELRNNNQGIIKLVSNGLNKPINQEEISVVFETPVSARLNGGNRIGMVVVNEAVDLAIKKAKTSGMAIVGCSGYASATGALGYWTRKLADHGLVGIVMSQCNEMVAPCGSYEPIFGTNPISIGIPTKPRAQILDMATSAIAYYGVKLAAEAGESIPEDVAYTAQGYPTTNPLEALQGAIRVFDRSHKGSHLALMVELLAGAFTGAAMEDKAQNQNWGSLVIAIRPDILGDEEGFLKSAMIMCERVKQAKLLPEEKEGSSSSNKKKLYLPGERGDEVEESNLRAGTLEIPEEVYKKLLAMLPEEEDQR